MAANTDFSTKAEGDPRALRFFPADADAARTLTGPQVDRFNRDGFLSGLRAFDEREISEIRAYFDDLLDAVLGADDRRNAYSINAYHLVCAGIYDLLLTPILLDYGEDILGPTFGCWGSHAFCKLAGDPMEVPLHQDATYWPLTPSRSVTVWLALDDADEDNGAMQFVPGSHLEGPLPHEELALDGSRVLKRQVVDPDRYGERTTNGLEAGQVSLHSDLLLHGSGPNRSDRRRAGLTIRYAAGEVKPLAGWEAWFKPAVHCRGELPGHWPHRRRPSGEEPEKMAAFTGDFDGNPVASGG